jgi:hypothetical protein
MQLGQLPSRQPMDALFGTSALQPPRIKCHSAGLKLLPLPLNAYQITL